MSKNKRTTRVHKDGYADKAKLSRKQYVIDRKRWDAENAKKAQMAEAEELQRAAGDAGLPVWEFALLHPCDHDTDNDFPNLAKLRDKDVPVTELTPEERLLHRIFGNKDENRA